MPIDMSPDAVKLRRFSFLSGYTLRTDTEELEVQSLNQYFHSIGNHPGWKVWPREFLDSQLSGG
jgi:hypothetical protein